jgi:3-methyladenine DNA glycosylase Tag
VDAATLASVGDDRYLSLLTRRIFRAGLKHSLVDAKWPAFEEVFFGFDPEKVVLMSGERLERLMQDARLIRHLGKLRSVPINAQMVLGFQRSHGSFGQLLAEWPTQDIVGLWELLTKRSRRRTFSTRRPPPSAIGRRCRRPSTSGRNRAVARSASCR